MALINKIRKNSGVAIFVVAIGLLLFLVGGDLLSPGSVLFGSNDNTVGEIEGERIDRQRFDKMVEEVSTSFKIQSGKAPTTEQLTSIRTDAWNKVIFNTAYLPVLQKLGVDVTKKERDDMITGNNIHPTLRQSFTDPQTGQFNKQQLLGYVQFIQQPKPQNGMDERSFQIEKARWQILLDQLPEQRIQTKYANLIAKSTYVTTREAERNYMAGATQANVKYVYVPYYSLADSSVQVTDAELNAYLKDNSELFQVEASRSMEYAVFNFEPSAEDTMFVLEEIKEIKEDFKSFANDTMFVRANSDNPKAPSKLTLDQLPGILRDSAEVLDSGDVFGPYLNGDKYVLHKVTEVTEDSVYSANASHILIKWESEDNKSEARGLARRVLDGLKQGADFAEMAARHSDDMSNAKKGGDLGWFAEGRMVPEFNDAVFNFEGTGLLNDIVETQFGYHIIRVDREKTNTSYVVSTIERGIYAGDETRDKVYARVGQFVANIKGLEDFRKAVENDPTLASYTSNKLTVSDAFLRGAGQAREVVRWAFQQDEENIVSEVFTLEDAYVVAAVTGIQEEGTADLESVREEVAIKVRNRKKATQIIEKMPEGSLEDKASAFDNVDVRTANAQNLALNSISGIGVEPKGVGTIFSMDKGQVSAPVEGDNGIIVFELASLTKPEPKESYPVEKNSKQQSLTQRAMTNVFQAMKELTDIVDRRYRYF